MIWNYKLRQRKEVDRLLLPIIMIVVCVLLGGGTLFLKFSEKRKKAKGRDKEELAQMTANEFVNVKDIRGVSSTPVTAWRWRT